MENILKAVLEQGDEIDMGHGLLVLYTRYGGRVSACSLILIFNHTRADISRIEGLIFLY